MSSTKKNGASLRLVVMIISGFASGLPLALSGTALQAWLSTSNVDISTIGFFSLVGLPYTLKFLWAPLLDRFEPPFLGRRRGWLVVIQLLMAGALVFMSTLDPVSQTKLVALGAVIIAFLSASQDISIDAYRTDLLEIHERGVGSSLTVFGYRLAMVLSGGIVLVWADAVSGNGWSWPKIYQIMAMIMVVLAGFTWSSMPRIDISSLAATRSKTNARHELLGFGALLLVAITGYWFTSEVLSPICKIIGSSMVHLFSAGAIDAALVKKWCDLAALLVGLAVTIPLGWMVSKKTKFETLNLSLQSFFSMKRASLILGLIVLYKLGDAFGMALTTPFLLKGAGFAPAEVGVVNKVIGIWMTIIGAFLGGLLMVRLKLYRSLLIFGILQGIAVLGFWAVAVFGKDYFGSLMMPAFNLVVVALKEPTRIDLLLLSAMAAENITSGMGTAGFAALLMSLCNRTFSATQYAFLSAFSSIGRVWVGPMAGVLAASLGWPRFFIFASLSAIPGLWILVRLKSVIMDLDNPSVEHH